MIDDIIELCIKRQWWEADELFEKYLKNCYELWKQYDTLFNYQINKCEFRAIVKQNWSEAEQYPLINRLTCVNENCLFYLVFNSDISTN